MTKSFISAQRGFFPQPAYLIGAYDKEKKANFTLITWITFCSVEPPMLMFASRGKKLMRELVETTKQFSANLVTEEMKNMADYCGTTSGYKENKCAEFGIAYTTGSALDVPILEKSPWIYECKLVNMIEAGSGFIYVGQIEGIIFEDKIEETGYGKINMEDIKPLIYSPGSYYGIGSKIGSVGDSKH